MPFPSAALAPGETVAASFAEQFAAVRRCTEELCAPLATEDYVIQSMPEASPAKWHLAHTSWFFETFVLHPHVPGYRSFHPEFNYLFNSYYQALGPRWARDQRGVLSRPTVEDTYRYRKYIDDQIRELLDAGNVAMLDRVADTIVLGLHHEQQHQELILTDLKHAFAQNPLRPAYHSAKRSIGAPPPSRWVRFAEALVEIGHAGAPEQRTGTFPQSSGPLFRGAHFAYDNERPRHKTLRPAFRLANRLVTNAEYLAFMTDGGYAKPQLWLSDGWAARQAGDWQAPLYWEKRDETWSTFTLTGQRPIGPDEPVCHVSYYEADAFARWARARLPTEAEWESAAETVAIGGHFLEAGRGQPGAMPAADDHGPLFQLFGDVWQWTASPHVSYPGYRQPAGALGEYNGKFMCNQMVLRGASCATPRSHARRTYRNFFPPEARWQFSGIRLASDA
jgi:ergothioneine biosynthesis protein EgtB